MNPSAAIALALVLDFSGSMEQKLDERTKRQILAENIVALTSSLPTEAHVRVVSFGAGAAASCSHIEERVLPANQVASWVQKQIPKAFSATPLAAAIRKLSKSSVDQVPARVLIVTDGRDTCGDDPCKALEDLEAKIAGASRNLRVDLLGYDLKAEEAEQLQCKNSRFSKLQLKSRFSKDDFEFQKNLQEAEREARESLPPPAGMASLTILDSPAEAVFEAEYRAPRIPRKRGAPEPPAEQSSAATRPVRWKGAFPVLLQAGTQNVRLIEPQGGNKILQLGKGQKATLRFFADFRPPKADVKLKGRPLGVLLVPLQGQNSNRNESLKIPDERAIPAGQWRLTLDYPSWIKGEFRKDLELGPGQSRVLDFEKMLEAHLAWATPKPSSQDQVLELKCGASTQIILVPVRSGPIPHLKNCETSWR